MHGGHNARAQSKEAAHRRAEQELRRESDQVLRLRAEVKDMQAKKNEKKVVYSSMCCD
jgi:hypothetical protein